MSSLSAVATHHVGELILGDVRLDRRQFGNLMPPRFSLVCTVRGFCGRLPPQWPHWERNAELNIPLFVKLSKMWS
jgi:hypothetical protein